MEKFRNAEIKNFQFSDLQGKTTASSSDFKAFSFGELTGESFSREKVTDEGIRTERSFEKKNNFKIDGIVRDYRGLSRQEQTDLENRIQEEVNKRLEAAYQEAFAQGLEQGREQGKEEAMAAHQDELAQRVAEFSNTISEVQAQGSKLLEASRAEIVEFVKRFTKWIVLKEINEKLYLESLLEKLILELNARKNIIVKVGRDNFKEMPQIISAVEAKVGQLSNVRVEIVPEINHPGIILETENGLIDGTIEGVFINIDKIFEQVIKTGNNT